MAPFVAREDVVPGGGGGGGDLWRGDETSWRRVVDGLGGEGQS